MDLLERVILFGIGCAFGYLLTRIVDYLREIKEEVDEVLELEKNNSRPRDEAGIMRFPVVADIMLLLVVIVTVWAAVASQKASNTVEDQQDDIAQITTCNQEFLGAVLIAVNERTTFTADQARANINLQQSQSEFLAIVLEDPPRTDEERSAALRAYFSSLNEFIKINGNAAQKAEENPYPTIEQFTNCIENN